jgi:hypothetical protein
MFKRINLLHRRDTCSVLGGQLSLLRQRELTLGAVDVLSPPKVRAFTSIVQVPLACGGLEVQVIGRCVRGEGRLGVIPDPPPRDSPCVFAGCFLLFSSSAFLRRSPSIMASTSPGLILGLFLSPPRLIICASTVQSSPLVDVMGEWEF